MSRREHQSLVDTNWLSGHLNDPDLRLIHVDWIGTESYDDGHIPGAIGWNWKEWLWDPLTREFPTPETFARRCGAAGISNDTTVVIYGEPIQFGTYAWWVFKYMNHRDVRLLDGGLVRWRKEGRRTVGTPAALSSAPYGPPTHVNHHLRARREEVLASLDAFREGRSTLLDHRSPEEFRGERVNVPGKPDVGAERHGRIPGAKHLHYADFLNSDTTFRSPPELESLLREAGASPDKEIVSYCRLSHRAALACFVMTELLGYEKVKNYDGSWTEWGSMVGMPIER